MPTKNVNLKVVVQYMKLCAPKLHQLVTCFELNRHKNEITNGFKLFS